MSVQCKHIQFGAEMAKLALSYAAWSFYGGATLYIHGSTVYENGFLKIVMTITLINLRVVKLVSDMYSKLLKYNALYWPLSEIRELETPFLLFNLNVSSANFRRLKDVENVPLYFGSAEIAVITP